MKHIKKKFLINHKVEKEAYHLLTNTKNTNQDLDKILSEGLENVTAYVFTEDRDVIQCFQYQINNKVLFIPEPNPIVIYFSNAQTFLKNIEDERNKLFKILGENNPNVGNIQNTFYNFFGYVSNYVTSLFNSLEAFINAQIPNNYEYKRISQQKTEIFNKQQIQKEISFDEKLKKVIPHIKNKSFHQEFSHKHELMISFKNFRDEIVHTKVDVNNSSNYYQALFSKALDFDYLKTIEIIKDYINYYENGLIEKCNCGKDY